MSYKCKVGIIGAGAAGLCAIRHFATRKDKFHISAFEQSDDIGGIWKYSEHAGIDPINNIPVHSSMYKNLRTNLPMQIMEYPDFKSNLVQSFVHHSEMLKYLNEYAKQFQLIPFIKFNHMVVRIARNNDQWMVKFNDIKNHKELTKYFDILLICTGRYSLPIWPSIDGLKRFGGRMMHSHDYRVPEIYKGQRVAVIGGGLSGVDISIELSSYAEQVIFVNHRTHYENLPLNIQQINAEVKEFEIDSMIVKDRINETLTKYYIDSVIMATGYYYNLKFIDSNCGIKMNDNGTIDGLYKHMINIEYPSMALLGVPNQVLPLPLYHQQIKYFLKIQLGQHKLPSKEEMMLDTEQDIEKSFKYGLRPKDRHNFKVARMVKYLNQLTAEAHLEPLPKVIIDIHRDLYDIRQKNIINYKQFNYKLISDEKYEVYANI